jgi:hypothetical protein
MKLAVALVLWSSAAAHAEPPGETDPHDLAEARYQHVRLRVDPDDDTAHHFAAYRGIEADPMGSQDFYREVGRPDLALAHHGRRVLANASLVGGIALYGLTTYELIRFADRAPDFGACDPLISSSKYQACFDGAEAKAKRDADAHAWPLFGSAVGMVAAFTIATWMYVRPEPVTEGEARSLAEQHNRDVRYRMGLVPYVDDGGGGVTVTGAW